MASYSISANEGVAWVGPVVVISGVSSTGVTVTSTVKVPTLLLSFWRSSAVMTTR